MILMQLLRLEPLSSALVCLSGFVKTSSGILLCAWTERSVLTGAAMTFGLSYCLWPGDSRVIPYACQALRRIVQNRIAHCACSSIGEPRISMVNLAAE